MTEEKTQTKKSKVAWGITGAGDKIAEYLEVMKVIKKEYEGTVEIQVFLSKAAETVLKFYRLEDDLKQNFARVTVEVNSNAPFLAAWMQMRKYEFLLIAPATSNTVAKIAVGICDTLLSNSAIMAGKAFVPVYVMPTDFSEGNTVTKPPNGKSLRLRVRKEDAENTRRLAAMDGITLLKQPENIRGLFEKHFGQP